MSPPVHRRCSRSRYRLSRDRRHLRCRGDRTPDAHRRLPAGPAHGRARAPRRGRGLRPRVALRLRRALRGHLDLARAHGAGDVGEARDRGPRAQPPSCHDDRRGHRDARGSRTRAHRVRLRDRRDRSVGAREGGAVLGDARAATSRRFVRCCTAMWWRSTARARRCCTTPTSRRPRDRSTSPILLSAIGPKGREIADEIADGIITVGTGDEGFDVCVGMMNGTVLDPGEDVASPRGTRGTGALVRALVPRHLAVGRRRGRRAPARRRVARGHRSRATRGRTPPRGARGSRHACARARPGGARRGG